MLPAYADADLLAVVHSLCSRAGAAAFPNRVLAAPLLRAGGNAHNQLAVLATYADAELPAVVHYFRSLSAPQPFAVARQNLAMLFEQNRARHDALPPPAGPANAAGGRGRDAPRDKDRSKVPMLKLLTELSTRFVRLHGEEPASPISRACCAVAPGRGRRCTPGHSASPWSFVGHALQGGRAEAAGGAEPRVVRLHGEAPAWGHVMRALHVLHSVFICCGARLYCGA